MFPIDPNQNQKNSFFSNFKNPSSNSNKRLFTSSGIPDLASASLKKIELPKFGESSNLSGRVFPKKAPDFFGSFLNTAPLKKFNLETNNYTIRFKPSNCHKHGYRTPEEVNNPFLKSAMSLNEQVQSVYEYDEKTGKERKWVNLSVNGQKIRVDFLPQKGEHSIVGRIAAGQPQVYPGIPNERILFKTFSDHSILAKAGAGAIREDTPEYVLRQYDMLQNSDCHTAAIYNLEEARAGCGYFLVEYVPNEFRTPWELGARINDLGPQAKRDLEQLARLFSVHSNNDMIPDLQPANLRQRDNGDLVLIDLREQPTPPEDKKIEWIRAAMTFNCKQGDDIFNYLLSGVSI